MTLKVAWELGPELEAERVLPQRWNGWAVPVMTRAQVEAFIAAYSALAEEAPADADVITLHGDVLIVDAPESAKEVADVEPSQIHPDSEGLYTLDLGWTFDTVDVPLIIVLDADERCPCCGSDDLSLWAEDGESPRADYWACEACHASGGVVQPEGASNADVAAREARPTPESLIRDAREDFNELDAEMRAEIGTWRGHVENYVEGHLEILTDDGIVTRAESDALFTETMALHNANRPVVTFKHEDEIDGQPLGPVTVLHNGHRVDRGWMLRADALALAQRTNAIWEES